MCQIVDENGRLLLILAKGPVTFNTIWLYFGEVELKLPFMTLDLFEMEQFLIDGKVRFIFKITFEKKSFF